MKKILIPSFLLIAILLSGLISFFPVGATAQVGEAGPTSEDYENESWRIIPKECISPSLVKEGEKKECDLDSFVQLFINLANIGKKVLPYLTMVMVIWAGFNLIMAGGNPEKIQSGKKMLTSIFLGIIIILVLAWSWSYFVIYVMTGSDNLFEGYGKPWEKEWWGGDPGPEQTPEMGCCVVNEFGCKYTDKEECDTLKETYKNYNGQQTSHTPGLACNTTYCDNLATGTQCCAPKPIPENSTCFRSHDNKRVCLDFQTPNITHPYDENCDFLANCEVIIDPQ